MARLKKYILAFFSAFKRKVDSGDDYDHHLFI